MGELLKILHTIGPIASLVAAIGWVFQFIVTQRAKRDLEVLKIQMKGLINDRQDALIRKREVYAKFITGMRVFIERTPPWTQSEKDAFLKAYDESCLWTSTAVGAAIGQFLQLAHTGHIATQEEKKAAYQNCVRLLRNECLGLVDDFEFQFVQFGS